MSTSAPASGQQQHRQIERRVGRCRRRRLRQERARLRRRPPRRRSPPASPPRRTGAPRAGRDRCIASAASASSKLAELALSSIGTARPEDSRSVHVVLSSHLPVMDYKATLNLPETDFPMKADLAKREPELLARWAEGELYDAHPRRPPRRAALRAPRRAALRQRQHPLRPHPQQDPQGHRLQVPHDGRPLRRVQAGLGLPRPAHRARGAARARRQDRQACRRSRSASACHDYAHEVGRHPARRVQAARRVRHLGRSVPDASTRRTKRRSCASSPSFARKGLLVPGEEAGALVHVGQDGARRGGDRVRRGARLAVDLRQVRDPVGGRASSRSSGRPRRGRCRPTSRSPTTRRSSYVTVRASGERYIVAEELADTFVEACELDRRRARASRSPSRASRSLDAARHPFIDRALAASCPPTTSRSSRAPASCTPRPATAPTTT